MKLNSELVREAMIYFEEKCSFEKVIVSTNIDINGYTKEDITYTVLKLKEAGYINTGKPCYGYELPIVHISSLTWNGHKFLDTVRDDKVWKKTKDIVNRFTSVSINIIENVATNVLMNMINNW